MNISGTITHVSETDHSRDHIPSQHNSYPSTPGPLTGKPILNHTTSTPLNYPQISPNSNHNWNGRLTTPQSIVSHSRVSGTLVGQPSPNQTPIFENGKMPSHYGQYTNVPRNSVNSMNVNNINNESIGMNNNNTSAGAAVNNNNHNHNNINQSNLNKTNSATVLEAYQNRQPIGSTPLSSGIPGQAGAKDGKNRLEKRFAALSQHHDKSSVDLNVSAGAVRKSCPNMSTGSDIGHSSGSHNKHSSIIADAGQKKCDGISLLSHVNGPSVGHHQQQHHHHQNVHKSDRNNGNGNTFNNYKTTIPAADSNTEQLHNGMLVEKRQITLFKVIEQFIHPITRTVLKENVLQNVELTTPCGRMNYDAGDLSSAGLLSHSTADNNNNNNNNTSHTETSLLTNGSRPADNSSAMFADISGLSSRNKSKLQVSSNSNTNNNNRSEPTSSSDDNSKTIKVKDDADIDKEESEASSNRSLSSTASPSQISSSNNSSPKECSVLSPSLSTPLDSPTVPEIKATSSKKVKKTALLKNDDSEDSNDHERKKSSVASSLLSQFERMRPGIKVLAKWKDKNYYPAEVMKQLAGNKWSVKFDDSQTKNVFENEVVRLEYLAIEQEIMLSTSNDTCVKATIHKIYSKNIKTLEFDLEHFENGKDVMKRYRLSDIFLNPDQGAAILNRTGHKKIISKNSSESVFADVDLDNIVSGKRSRSNKVELQSNKKSNHDSVQHQQPTQQQQQQQQQQQNQEQNQEQPIQTPNTSSESDAPVRKKRKVAEKSSSQQKEQSRTVCTADGVKKASDTIVESKIFQKCSFLIVDINDDCLLHDKPFSGGEQMKGTLREHLIKLIHAGQGQVFETFQQMKKATQLKNCYLLSKSYNTTLKYFQCLASGVPIISHLWIIESSRSAKLLDRNSFVLPSGFSLHNNTAITELSLIQASNGLFKDSRIYCKIDHNQQQIVDILKASDAIVLLNDDIHDVFKDDTKPDLIIVESCEPSDELVNKANDSRIPILKRDYILQCLINGRKLSFDEQPNFTLL